MLGYLMSSPKGKSYREQYDDKLESYKKTVRQLENFSDNAIVGKEKAQKRADKLSQELDQLEPLKNKVRLSDSAKTYLADIYTQVNDGRDIEDVKSKYLEKGLHMEEDAITLYSLVTGVFHKKSEEYRDNGYINGHIDFPTVNDTIVDTKCNWSIWQFNRIVARPVNPIYRWQGNGYMWLWEKQRFELAYCLLNTPEHLIQREIKKLEYDFIGSQEDFAEAVKEIRHNHTYDDKPNKERIRIYKFERNTENEELIKKYVIAAREYLNNFGKDTDDYETI
jgi:hypothetical protein